MQAWLHLSWLVMERAGVTERVVKNAGRYEEVSYRYQGLEKESSLSFCVWFERCESENPITR